MRWPGALGLAAGAGLALGAAWRGLLGRDGRRLVVVRVVVVIVIRGVGLGRGARSPAS